MAPGCSRGFATSGFGNYGGVWLPWRKQKRSKTTVIMQFGGLAKTLGKSRNVKWQPSCTNDGRLYPQRLQTRSRTESVLGHRDVTARGHINEVDLVCLQKKRLAGPMDICIYIYIYIYYKVSKPSSKSRFLRKPLFQAVMVNGAMGTVTRSNSGLRQLAEPSSRASERT